MYPRSQLTTFTFVLLSLCVHLCQPAAACICRRGRFRIRSTLHPLHSPAHASLSRTCIEGASRGRIRLQCTAHGVKLDHVESLDFVLMGDDPGCDDY